MHVMHVQHQKRTSRDPALSGNLTFYYYTYTKSKTQTMCPPGYYQPVDGLMITRGLAHMMSEYRRDAQSDWNRVQLSQNSVIRCENLRWLEHRRCKSSIEKCRHYDRIFYAITNFTSIILC